MALLLQLAPPSPFRLSSSGDPCPARRALQSSADLLRAPWPSAPSSPLGSAEAAWSGDASCKASS
eukprot:8632681-Alexandrium_andersonii.AAC.1